MARAANVKLKCNPPLGSLPVLQYLRPADLQVDPAYQRSVEGADSQALIRKIAQHWNWDLCLPLVVSMRPGGGLFVIDGQHRAAAAKLRGDIDQVPATVKTYASPADEAAAFVHLNQLRRPLTKLDVFKAAVAGEDPEARAIMAAIEAAGLKLAPHTNYTAWKPRMINNIGGIEAAWRRHGAQATTTALAVLGCAFERDVLRYAGTLFPGIVGIVAEDGEDCEIGMLADMLAQRSQMAWRGAIMQARATDPNLNFTRASEQVLSEAWDEWLGEHLGEAA